MFECMVFFSQLVDQPLLVKTQTHVNLTSLNISSYMPINDSKSKFYDSNSFDSQSEEASITSENSEEIEQQECPLCLEAFDATDKQFRPCKCGYQVSITVLNFHLFFAGLLLVLQ